MQQVGNERTHESAVVGTVHFDGRLGHQQSGDVRYRVVVANACKAAHTGFLQRYGQQTTESPRDSGSLLVALFEVAGVVGDSVARVAGQSPQIIAALLLGELRMAGLAHKEVRCATVVERAAVLHVSDAIDGHASFSVHRQAAGTGNFLPLSHEALVVWDGARVAGDESFRLHFVLDIAENCLGVVFGVAQHGCDRQVEFLFGGGQQTGGHCHLAYRVRFGDLPERQLGVRIDNGMVSIPPEIIDPLLPGLGK